LSGVKHVQTSKLCRKNGSLVNYGELKLTTNTRCLDLKLV